MARNNKIKRRELKAKGELDYDFRYDILFFKSQNREYEKSIEIGNFVIDIDSENFVVGIQIYEASKFLHLNKTALLKVPNWRFQASIKNNRLEFRLMFQVVVRNRVIEKNPIIMQPVRLPNSRLICKR